MSFASDVKNELCRVPLGRHCCAVAEAYGVLLYCHTFTTREIRIVTACDAFAERLPKLFRRAFGAHFALIRDFRILRCEFCWERCGNWSGNGTG